MLASACFCSCRRGRQQPARTHTQRNTGKRTVCSTTPPSTTCAFACQLEALTRHDGGRTFIDCGLSGMHPLQNTRPRSVLIACEYGPIAPGALGVEMVVYALIVLLSVLVRRIARERVTFGHTKETSRELQLSDDASYGCWNASASGHASGQRGSRRACGRRGGT